MPPPAAGRPKLAYENEDLALLSSFEKRGYRTYPILYVNGARVPSDLASQARPNQTLLSFLRDVLRLTGSKLGCAEGGCGACTVLVSRYDDGGDRGASTKKKIRHGAVNACLMPVLAADGCHVTTIEGVGTVKGDKLHPIQRAMVDMHGSQCGFCTPGIIVALYGLFAENPTVSHLEEHLDGNLCRCTGYRPIWDAARSLCVDAVASQEEDGDAAASTAVVRGPCGTPCRDCPERNDCDAECNVSDRVAEREEKKSDAGAGGEGAADSVGCCSSSTSDKIAEMEALLRSGNIGNDKADDDGSVSSSWLNQPDDMFPTEIVSPDGAAADEAAKPLVCVDATFHNGGAWFKPTTLVELLRLLRDFAASTTKNGESGGGCKIVVGNTEVGIETKFKHASYHRLVYPSHAISSLYTVEWTGSTGIHIGACAPLSDIQRRCEEWRDGDFDTSMKRVAGPIHDMLRWFASTQIRNVACLGGNLVTASPISDMNPMLAALNAKLTISSFSGNDGGSDDGVSRRTVAVPDFFRAYRTVDLRPDELLECVEVPAVRNVFEYVAPFKQARRREDDISIVTSGMRLRLVPKLGAYEIADVSLAFGGMAPTTVVASKTAESMIGRSLSEETFQSARRELQKELALPQGTPGGQEEYRLALASSFLFRFYLGVVSELEKDVDYIQLHSAEFNDISLPLPPVPVARDDEKSAAKSFVVDRKPSVRGMQNYPTPKVAVGLESRGTNGKTSETLAAPEAKAAAEAFGNKVSVDAVGKPSPHASAPLHCTGEALYADDIPAPPSLLHASLLLASQCNVKVVSIDAAPALKIPGVVAVYTHEDIVKLGGDNRLGPITKDEVAFVPLGQTVEFVGQVLGVVVGDSLEIAEAGARAVCVTYSKSAGKPIVSIKDAIDKESFFDFARHTIERGDVNGAFSMDNEGSLCAEVGRLVTVEGSFRCGGQEHFYLETNSTLVVPSESDLTIYASTQAPTKTQTFCASVTNTPASKVVVRMKRMGGGFGGKETRTVFSSCAAAVAAKLCGRPVRLTLGRDVDMSITGGRHAFLAKYRASAIIDGEGKGRLHGLDVQLYSNGGCHFDLSGPVMDRALLHVDGCYNWPNFRAVGVPCKTCQPPHTAFRGFGGPQGIAICEHVIDHLSLECSIPVDRLRRENIYRLDQCTPFGMRFGDQFSGKWSVPAMWDRLFKQLEIPSRRRFIAEFNSKHKWVKRGLSILPTKFGIAFTAKFMNQGGALVHLYTDGTVLVTHGGTEMGQGLHTKVCQVAAQAFGVPIDHVYVNDTSTDKVANTIPTAASMSTDTYGMATLDACRQILKRLQPVREELGPEASLRDVAQAAHMARIDLSAHGFFALDESRCGFDWEKVRPEGYPSDLPVNSWKGHPFNYFTQGIACSEVEVDVLTGNHKTLRADVLMDVGASVNPVIDIGQIEGAFVQGMGWSTLEEVVYADDDHTWIRPAGKTFTSGPGTYKIPAFNDVPEVFNVTLMDNVDNPFAVHSSKAIGEPPFFLGCSVYHAIKDAVTAARADHRGSEYFEMRMPATSERVRMMCADIIAAECLVQSSLVGKAGEENECDNLDEDQLARAFQPKGSC